ncbi:RNA polymerase sigma factor SigY [Gorillibacterium sp. sgz5001074]|uniref:RNA polymerase sigma factor SigY n=1 Tax=Gorillibacterium sp. sgz5001074 TaxID=3446695 RepID=UPI003F6720C9
MQDEDERRLIENAKRGDRTALSLLLQRNYSFLMKYLIKATMQPGYAEDLAQETMLRAMEKIRLYNGQSKFSSWLITIGTRLYIDSLRKRKRELRWQEEQEQSLRKLRWQAEYGGSEWPDVLDALGVMPEEIRLPIILKHYYGYAYEEIAGMMDIPPGTVKSRIHNGLKSLRKELSEHEG